MADSSVVRKLQIKPGQRIVFVNPPPGYLDEIAPLPEGVELVDKLEGTFDFVHLFVRNVAELERFAPAAISALKRDGLLWISYPKQSAGVKTDINRDKGWEAVNRAGLRPVSQVSIDDNWSALRFRPYELVGKDKK